MDGRIHEGVQSQGAAPFEGLAPFEERIERRACQRKDQQRNGMTSRALLQFLNGIGGEIAGRQIQEQMHNG